MSARQRVTRTKIKRATRTRRTTGKRTRKVRRIKR